MNAVARAAGVAEAKRIASERVRLLDHSVCFQQEDPWRDPESDDPLAPRYEGEPYPRGKQVAAAMHGTSRAEEVAASSHLSEIQADRQRQVIEQYRAIQRDRLRQAEGKPVAVIEPRGSLPTLDQTVTELEKRTLIPITEIRACFRQGRRSAEQQAVRALVEDAIRAMVKHYRMAHPHAGSAQYRQAREASIGFGHVGTKGWRKRDAAVEAWAFGDIHHDGLGEIDKGVADVFSVKLTNTHDSNRSALRRPGGKARKPQITRCLCDALDVSQRTLRSIIGVETAASFDREMREAL